MRFTTLRNLLLSMIVLGIAGSVVGVGTFASFNATVTSAGNTFSTASITFSDTPNGGSACTSTAGGTTSCTTAVGSLAGMVPGDSKFGTVVLNNGGTVAVSLAMSVADASPNALTTTSIGSASSSPTSAGLGMVLLECTNSGGTDEGCLSTDGSGKVKVLYGSCTGSVTTISTALPITTSTFSTTSLTDNGIKVNGTECWGGNTGAGISTAVSNLSLSSSLATSGNVSLAVLIYLPSSVSSSTLQNLSGNSLTYTWVATQLAGSSH